MSTNHTQSTPPLALKMLSSVARKRLRIEADTRICEGDLCFNETANKRYCSKACSGRARFQANAKAAGAKAGDARRGSNPSQHIRIRLANGKRMYLHRHVVESQIGAKLGEREVVHHKDRDKHHNCFWKNPCVRCTERGEPNLEVLVGQEAHAKMHAEELQQARRRKKR